MRSLLLLAVVAIFGLTACSSSNPYQDLDEFIAEKKAQPGGRIKPIPPLVAYEPFNYSASGLRAPFSRPIIIKEIAELKPSSDVEPDETRVKEFLEQFSLDTLSMVGAIEMAGEQWALLEDAEGSVHRVKKGMFLGRNHGRIVEAADNYIALIEIVPNGPGWVQRPRTIELKTNE